MKITIVKSYSNKNLEVEVISDRYCREDHTYIMSREEPRAIILEDPSQTIKKLKDSYERKLEHRLEGLYYWKEKYEKSVDS